jgi:molecular chaperone DnaK (HSP70)
MDRYMSDPLDNFFESHEATEPVLGIDLGTTNTVAAYCRAEASCTPELIRYGPDSVSLRSLLNIGNLKNGRGTVLVGRAAEQRAEMEPDPRTLISNFKSDLGCTKERRDVFRRKLTAWSSANEPMDPEDAAAYVLHYVRERASRQLQDSGHSEHSEHIRRAVLGIPARATQEYRLSLQRAAEIAGLSPVLLVPEPVAAGWMYHLTRPATESRRLLVVDIGAGTTDLSLVDLAPNSFRILLTGGDTQCGGTVVDHQVLRYLAEKYPGVDSSLSNFANWQAVRLAKEKANLLGDCGSMMDYVQYLTLSGKGERHQVSLSGVELHENAQRVAVRLQPLFAEFLQNGLAALPSDERGKPIERILLVGGACRTQAFLEEISAIVSGPKLGRFFLLDSPFTVAEANRFAADSYFAVARGLAVIGKNSGSDYGLATDMYFTERLVDPVGLGVINERDTNALLPPGVLRNRVHLEAFMPLGRTAGDWRVYTLSERAWGKIATSVRIVVLAGEGYWVDSDRAADVAGLLRTARCMGEFEFRLSFPRDGRYVRVAALYEMDANGVVTVRVRDLGGDDPDKGRCYPAQPISEAKVIRLEFGQLDGLTTKKKRERLRDIIVRGELFDEVGNKGSGN